MLGERTSEHEVRELTELCHVVALGGVQITQRDSQLFGYTAGCLGCRPAVSGKSRQANSEDGRNRLERPRPMLRPRPHAGARASIWRRHWRPRTQNGVAPRGGGRADRIGAKSLVSPILRQHPRQRRQHPRRRRHHPWQRRHHPWQRQPRQSASGSGPAASGANRSAPGFGSAAPGAKRASNAAVGLAALRRRRRRRRQQRYRAGEGACSQRREIDMTARAAGRLGREGRSAGCR